MKFSVLLSIYHKEDPANFDEALTSIWDSQTLKPSEIVLVKDGPLTAELDTIIGKWKIKLEEILKVVPLVHNVGLGKALNTGFEHCSHDWVMRMDTDDIALPDRFKKQVDYIEKNPDVALVGGQIEEFKGTLDSLSAKRVIPTEHEEIVHFAQSRSPFNHPTIAMKKDSIEAVGMYQHHLLMEDYNLWIRVLASGYKTANLPDTLLYMRSDGMHGRRRGWIYVKSEWQLYKLKTQLKFQSRFKALSLFFIRSSVRLLPASLLQYLYRLVRK